MQIFAAIVIAGGAVFCLWMAAIHKAKEEQERDRGLERDIAFEKLAARGYAPERRKR